MKYQITAHWHVANKVCHSTVCISVYLLRESSHLQRIADYSLKVPSQDVIIYNNMLIRVNTDNIKLLETIEDH